MHESHEVPLASEAEIRRFPIVPSESAGAVPGQFLTEWRANLRKLAVSHRGRNNAAPQLDSATHYSRWQSAAEYPRTGTTGSRPSPATTTAMQTFGIIGQEADVA
jgi:hypothetical protein